MTVPFLGSLLYFVLLSDHPAGPVIYGMVKAFTLCWPVVCLAWLWRQGLRPFARAWACLRGSFRLHLQALPLGIALGLLIVAALAGLLQTPLGRIVDESTPAIRGKADALGFLRHYLLFATFLSVMHSLIEEYYWRWFVFGHLRRLLSPGSAALAGSIAFASHHFVVTAQFFPVAFATFLTGCVALGGLLWCWLFQKQRTLAGAWISHLIADAGLMTVGYWLLR